MSDPKYRTPIPENKEDKKQSAKNAHSSNIAGEKATKEAEKSNNSVQNPQYLTDQSLDLMHQEVVKLIDMENGNDSVELFNTTISIPHPESDTKIAEKILAELNTLAPKEEEPTPDVKAEVEKRMKKLEEQGMFTADPEWRENRITKEVLKGLPFWLSKNKKPWWKFWSKHV